MLLFPIGLLMVMWPLAKIQTGFKIEKMPMFFMVFPLFIAGLYYVGLGAAITTGLAFKFTAKPQVHFDWIYWILALFTAVISVSGHGNSPSFNIPAREQELEAVRKIWDIAKIVMLILFFLFAFHPDLAKVPYGWILALLKLDHQP